MIRVGSYVWYHDRRDPTDIMKQFGECDVILLQRFPNALRSYFGDCWYIENWQSHGMLVRGCKQITTIELPNNIVPENQSQGKYIPILHMDNCKIISCLTSYDHAGMDEQLDFVCSLIDDDCILTGDMHREDQFINNLYNKYELTNHMEYNTFTNPNGNRIGLDKILTKSNIAINNVRVHEELAHNTIEHYPYEFTINV
tara:strand:+ start:958 stop:1554 length:597 start_codon:yes stop_codon:yes gene_type:complete